MATNNYKNSGCQEDNTMCRDGAKHLAEQFIQAIETRAQSGIGSDTTGMPELTRAYLALSIRIAVQFVPGMADTIKHQTRHHVECRLDDITFVPGTEGSELIG